MTHGEYQHGEAKLGVDTPPLRPVEGLSNGWDGRDSDDGHQHKSRDANQAGRLPFPDHPGLAAGQDQVRGQGRVRREGHGDLVVPGAVVGGRHHQGGGDGVDGDQEEADQTELFPALEPSVQESRESFVLGAVVHLQYRSDLTCKKKNKILFKMTFMF